MSAALFDSSALFGPTTGSKNQGKTGQGGSAADFCRGTAVGAPREHQFEKEAEAHGGSAQGRQINKEAGAHDVRGSDGESDEDSAPPTWVVEADQQAMLTLADNRSFRGTSASRMATDTRAAEAAPGWTGVGADYAAWLRDLRGNPTNPDSAITNRAPEWAYLVVMNGGDHLSVIHHLFRWKAPEGGRSRLD